MRSVEEWIGKNDDARPPPRVRLRIYQRHGGVCYLSGRKIRAGDKWDLEHIKALSLGGENRESNLAPALKEPHKKKTAIDRKIKAKDDRVRKKFLGIRPKSRFQTSRDGPFKQKIGGGIVARTR